MIQFPGSLEYQPIDTGFDAAAIAASAVQNGTVLPLRARRAFTVATILLEDAGPSTDLDLGFQPADEARAVIGTNVIPIVATMNPGAADVVAIHLAGGVVQASNGTPNNAGVALLGVGFGRLVVTNADGVNAATVTIRLLLGS